jgi:hypothetical protein
MTQQKIVAVQPYGVGYPLTMLDDLTKTWKVVRVLEPFPDNNERCWAPLFVLLEEDVEESARKQQRHEDYLRVVDRIVP